MNFSATSASSSSATATQHTSLQAKPQQLAMSLEYRALLEWYIATGVDEIAAFIPQPLFYDGSFTHSPVTLAADPSNPLMLTSMPNSSSTSSTPTLLSSAPVSPYEWVAKAKELALACKTVEELEAVVRSFEGCMLKKTATNTVFSAGNRQAKIMLIGEAPGANEDLEGIPFCGESGKLLDSMLNTIGISRAHNLYITNTLFWRPPGNRRPTEEELAVCAPFVIRHIELIAPKFIILCGSTATNSILTTAEPISRLRRQFHRYSPPYAAGEFIKTAVIFHPSYLLRQPSQKRLMWEDLLKIKTELQQLNLI